MEKHFWEFLNRQQHLYWKGFCKEERSIAIHHIEHIVAKYGYILDFHMFSDMEINLKIEIAENHLDALHRDLKGLLKLDDQGDVFFDSDQERILYINITFTKGTGDLRIEVPSVPG